VAVDGIELERGADFAHAGGDNLLQIEKSPTVLWLKV
jgi:hypothetical protein